MYTFFLIYDHMRHGHVRDKLSRTKNRIRPILRHTQAHRAYHHIQRKRIHRHGHTTRQQTLQMPHAHHHLSKTGRRRSHRKQMAGLPQNTCHRARQLQTRTTHTLHRALSRSRRQHVKRRDSRHSSIDTYK